MVGYWMIRTWEAGPVGEKVKYWIPGERPSRSARKLARDARKAAENRGHAERELARLLNANFTEGDLLVTLDYSEKAVTRYLRPRMERAKEGGCLKYGRTGAGAGNNPARARGSQAGKKAGGRTDGRTGGRAVGSAGAEEPEPVRDRLEDLLDCYGPEEDALLLEAERRAAQEEAELYLLRLQRAAKKQGIPVRYILTTSNMDGESRETVRVHHHLIIGAELLALVDAAGKPLLRSKWGRGGVDIRKLSAQPDYTPVAVYLLRQVRHTPDSKAWTASRGLVRPQPKDRAAISGSELRPPKGCDLLYRSEYIAGGGQYIRYIIRARQPARRE